MPSSLEGILGHLLRSDPWHLTNQRPIDPSYHLLGSYEVLCTALPTCINQLNPGELASSQVLLFSPIYRWAD